jgi:CzcA family heavy metal efflux pump
MTRRIVGSSLKFRTVVVAVAAATMVVGVIQLREMPVDTLPEFVQPAEPIVEVQSEAPGLSASEVESLVTINLEQLLNGLPRLETVHSRSVPGLSSIVLAFERGTDVMEARQLVQERIAVAATLPTVFGAPVMLQPLSATSRVMVVGLTSDTLSLIQMSVLARWTIRPRLMGVPGVANVATWGQRERQLQVRVDPGRLRARGVGLDRVVESTGDALWTSPLSFLKASVPGTGGWIDTPNQRLSVRHVLPISSAADLARVRVDGVPVRLGEVGAVVEGHPPLIGDALVGGRPGLLLVVEKFPGADTLAVTRGVEEALASLAPGLGGVEVDARVFRAASFVEVWLDDLTWLFGLGALLVVGLLGVLLFEWRAVLVALVAMSLSLLVAVLVVFLWGETLNVMVVAGLVVGLAVVIDDAVVGVEGVGRRLRRRGRQGGERSRGAVVLEATLAVRRPLLYATLVVLLTVVPLFFLGGLSGAFFGPLALSYGVAVAASFVVALTVTPALCLLLGAGGRPVSPLSGWLRRGYAVLLLRLVGRPGRVVVATGVAVGVALALVPFLGQSSLLPAFREPDLRVQWRAAPGTARAEMSRILARASGELRSLPGVRAVGAHVGRAVTGDQVVGINSGQLWVSLEPEADYEATVAAIRAIVAGYPGLAAAVQSYHREAVRQVLTGASDALVVRIYGPELGVLRRKAEQVRGALAGVEGLAAVRSELQVEEPHVEITVDLAAAGRHGLKPGDVRRAGAAYVAGITAGGLYEEQKVFDVVVWARPEARHSLHSLRRLWIDTPDGGRVRLAEVADVRITPTPTLINREADSRYVDVLATVQGRDLGAVTADVRERLAAVSFPLEYHPELLGEHRERRATLERMLALGIAAALGIFLLLQAAFGSWRLAALTFFSLPVALVGGIVAAVAAGGISLGALIGFLAVFALAARTGISLIGHYQRLHEQGQPFGRPLVLRGAQDRLAPILFTALATAFALTPLALNGPTTGQEIAHPLALVTLGGLATTTLTTLLILPTLYLRFGSGPEPEAAPSLATRLERRARSAARSYVGAAARRRKVARDKEP